jgi:hypothetical protein
MRVSQEDCHYEENRHPELDSGSEIADQVRNDERKLLEVKS